MITPADIERKVFRTTRLKEGYDEDEVDDFLDRVADSMRQMQQRIDDLGKELNSIRSRPKSNPMDETQPILSMASVEKVLIAAQTTANQLEADANAEAGRIKAQAFMDAENLRGQAQASAQTLMAEAEAHREKVVAEQEKILSGLKARVDDLNSRREQHRTYMRNALAKMDEEDSSG